MDPPALAMTIVLHSPAITLKIPAAVCEIRMKISIILKNLGCERRKREIISAQNMYIV